MRIWHAIVISIIIDIGHIKEKYAIDKYIKE